MAIYRANGFRLYATPEQATKMALIAGGCQFVRTMFALSRETVAQPGRGVRQTAGLNCSILDNGRFVFRETLAYQRADRSGELGDADPADCSRTCSACGKVDRSFRTSWGAFVCTVCGHVEHADANAAKATPRRGTPPMPVERRCHASGEDGTARRRAAWAA